MGLDSFSSLATRPQRSPFFSGGKRGDRPQSIQPETYSTRSLTINTTGAVINTAFPKAKLIGRLRFDGNVGLISLLLTSSMMSAADLIGVYAMREAGDVVDLSAAPDVLMAHLAHPSVNDFVAVPIARSNGMSFEREHAYFVSSGSSIGLYAFSNADVRNLLAVTMAAVYIPVQK